VLGSSERRVLVAAALILLTTAALSFRWPRVVAWPLGALLAWIALSLVARSLQRPRR
jgi:hypothetical protein